MHRYLSAIPLSFSILFLSFSFCLNHSAQAQLTINLGPDTVICGGSLTLDAGTFGAGATYLWSTMATSQTITVNTTGQYYVDVTDGVDSGSDTIFVTVAPQPLPAVVNDSVFCLGEIITLPARGSLMGQVLWYDSLSNGLDSLVGIGDTLFTTAASKDTFYAEVGTFLPAGRVGPSDNTFSSGAFIGGKGFGLTFDVDKTIRIDSVFIFADDTLTLEVSVEDANGTTLHQLSQLVEAIPSAKTVVPLGFVVGPGSDYRLIITQISGGRIYRNLGPSYPYTLPGLMSITKASNNSSNVLYAFYDWHVSSVPCPSPRTRAIVDIVSIPSLSLGTDTLICGDSLFLDAGNPGASYSWSTGEITQTVTIRQTDTITLIASFFPTCPASDTLIAYLFPTTASPSVNDSTFCRGEDIIFPASGGEDVFFWYLDNNGQDSLIAIGDTLRTQATDTTVYLVQTGHIVPSGRVGPPDNTFGSGVFLNAVGLGLSFDVLETAIIDSVAVYVDAVSTFEVSIRDAMGTVTHSRTVTANQVNTKTFVPLGFTVPPGTDYQMVMTTHSGGRLNRVLSPSYPYLLANKVSITGTHTGGGNPYYYFFDWHLSEVACIGPKDTVNAYVVPAPVLELGADTVICSDSLLLDAGNPLANHLWSTGATSQTIYVTATDTISVISSFTAQCQSFDTILVTVLQTPAAPQISDLTICGNGPIGLPATGQTTQVLWFDSDTSDQAIFVGDTLFTTIKDTITFYAEGATSLPAGRVGLLNDAGNSGLITGDSLGLAFDAYQNLIIDRVHVFATTGTVVEVSLQNAAKQILESTKVQVPAGGIKYPIDLGFVVPKGNGYHLIVSDVSQGSLSRTTQIAYPFVLPGVLSINSANTGANSTYYYLYDWEVSTFFCSSARSAATVFVKLPLELPPFTYSCAPLTLDATSGSGTYLWNTGATTSTLAVDTTGTYIVTVDDGAGCVVTDTAEIVIPVIDLGKDGILCGNTISSGYTFPSTFLWSTGDSTPDITVVVPDTFSVIVNEPNGCTLRDTIIITGFDNFPSVNIGNDTVGCEQICLSAGNPGLTYLWSTGDTTQTICVTGSGTYGVTVSNSNGCSSFDEVNVTVRQLPVADFAFVVNMCQVNFNNLSTLGSFNWNFGDGATSSLVVPNHVYLDTGTYTVRLIVTNSCGSDTMFQTVRITDCGTDGIDPLLGQAIELAPNPVWDQLRINFGAGTPAFLSMKVIAADGRICAHRIFNGISAGQQEEIELKNLPTGIYYIIFAGEKGHFAQKILKR